MSDNEIEKLKTWLENGPDPGTDGIARWRCIDLQRKIKAEFGHEYTERGIGSILKRIGYSHISARPHHPKGDPQAREDFKKNSR
jgi:transposase